MGELPVRCNFHHYDQDSGTIAMTNPSGSIVNKYAYDEYGNVLNQVEAVSNPFKYVGRYGVMADNTGLLYMRARYYDPETGRFLSKDPILFLGGETNLYPYALNNPINFIDPFGLIAWYDEFKFWDPTTAMGRQSISIGKAMGGMLAWALGERDVARLAFEEAAMDSGHAILQEANASACEYAAYYGALGVSAIAASAALAGGLAEMAGLIDTAPQANNIIRVISKPGGWGFRLDKAHHGKRWGHPHRWRW